METTIAVYEAKTQLSRLIDRAADGEKIVITRNGVPVTELRALRNEQLAPEAIVRAFRDFRSKQSARGTLRLAGETLRDLIHDGHEH